MTEGQPAAVWIVVPAFDEESRLGDVLDRLCARWPNVVVVDDASTDGTARVARARPVWLLTHATNLGQGAALQTGFSFALARGAEWVVTFDADGQHAEEDVGTLLAALASSGADFALGSRFLGSAPGIPASRRLILKLGVLFTRIVHGIRVTDAHNGLRAMTRRGALAIDLTLNRMEHASQLLDQVRSSRLAWVEAPVTIRYSKETLAKGQSSTDAVRLALRLLLERLLR